jgi:hypothetical protein
MSQQVAVENKDWKLFKNLDGTYDLQHTTEDRQLKNLTLLNVLTLASLVHWAEAQPK